MLLTVLLDSCLFLLLLLQLDGSEFFVLFIELVDLSPVLHIAFSSFAFLLFLLADGFFSFESEQFAFFHFLLVLVDVLLLDFLVLLPQVLLELFQPFLFLLLTPLLFLLPFLYLVLNEAKSTMVS